MLKSANQQFNSCISIFEADFQTQKQKINELTVKKLQAKKLEDQMQTLFSHLKIINNSITKLKTGACKFLKSCQTTL